MRPTRRDVAWAVGIYLVSILVLLAGEPQPLAILAGAGGGLTGTVILLRGFEQ